MKIANYNSDYSAIVAGGLGGGLGTPAPSGITSGTDGTTTVTPITSITVPPGGITDNGGGDAGLNFVTRTLGGQEGLVTVASSGAAYEIDISAGNTWDITLDDDCDLTFANWPASGVVSAITLVLRQGGAGSFTVTWPAEVDWQDTDGTGGGAAPTLWTAVGAQDVLVFATLDGGTTVGGSYFGHDGAGGTPATTVTDETTWGIAPAVGTDTEYARQDHTHGSPDQPTGGGIGPIVINDVHSTPLIFADLVQTEAGDDLVYADI